MVNIEIICCLFPNTTMIEIDQYPFSDQRILYLFSYLQQIIQQKKCAKFTELRFLEPIQSELTTNDLLSKYVNKFKTINIEIKKEKNAWKRDILHFALNPISSNSKNITFDQNLLTDILKLEMGFDIERIKEALIATNNANKEVVIDYLLNVLK